jgi:hypothetical protein
MLLSQDVNVSFKFVMRENLNVLTESKKLFFVTSCNLHLTKLHIQQILNNSINKTILTFKMDIFKENHEKIKDFMTKVNETILVLECLNTTEAIENQLEFDFSHFSNVTVILIGTIQNYTKWLSLNSNSIELIANQGYNFVDLAEETQCQLLDKRTVVFQGKKVLLKSLANSAETLKFLANENLEKLLKNENYLEISQRDESTIKNFADYYIPRQLERYVQMDRKTLVNNYNKNFLIVQTEEQFKEKCQEQTEASIHFLKTHEFKRNLFTWQKSQGPISELKILKQKEYCLFIDEDQLLNLNEKILIISANPGMGKSLILDKIIHDSNIEHFFIKIILNNFTKELKELKENTTINYQDKDLMDLILKSFLTAKSDEFEMAILKNLALKENKLVLMLDGVDEVSDYKEQVKCLIKTLNKTYKLKQIIMTTRSNLKEELEDCFQTISFDLKNFDTNDQINFLVKYWRQNLNTNMAIELELKKSADILLQKLRLNLTENVDQLIGIPLQTKMIADICFFNYENASNVRINKIADLYHEFIEKKFDIQFEEKYKIDFARNKTLYEREKAKFYEEHIRLASSILLKKKVIDVIMSYRCRLNVGS